MKQTKASESETRMRVAPINQAKASRSLVGNFEENVLNHRLQPVSQVDGYKVELRAACHQFQPQPLKSNVRVSFFSAGNSFPYLGQLSMDRRGYRIPRKGTIQVALFNPNGTLVKLFLLGYDLSDMPANSQTFLRQKTIFSPAVAKQRIPSSPTDSENNPSSLEVAQGQEANNRQRFVNYMIQLNIVSSKSGGRICLNKDVKIFVARKVDLETATRATDQDYELKELNEMPSNPKYFSR